MPSYFVGCFFQWYLNGWVCYLLMAAPFYASADFTDSDAGAGEQGLESLSEFVNVRVALDNLLLATSNFIERDTGDYLMKIRDFKKCLKNLCLVENLNLLNGFLKPEEENTNVATLIELGNTLVKEDFNPFSSDIFKNILIDLSGNNSDYYEDIGCDYDVFSKALLNLNKIYLKSLDELSRADGNLNEAFKNIKFTFSKINTILDLEVNDATADVFVSLSKYIHTTFSKYNLKELFDQFINSRRKYIHYHALIKANRATDTESGPLCSICLTETISHVLIGCGHTYCDGCSKKQLSFCYICRCKIRERMRIYLN